MRMKRDLNPFLRIHISVTRLGETLGEGTAVGEFLCTRTYHFLLQDKLEVHASLVISYH